MIYYTADLHFGYAPIIYNTARPFSSVEEMDETLIKNWNDTVDDDDTVYIVGDFSYNNGKVPLQYLSRLKGHKHLIRGNHDTCLEHQELFYEYLESVTDLWETEDGDDHVILCHYPIIHNKRSYMVHGHIHNQRGQGYEMLKELPHVLNAGVDVNFYRPVTLKELIRNNEMYYSEKYPDLFPVPPVPDNNVPGAMPRRADFRPLPVRETVRNLISTPLPDGSSRIPPVDAPNLSVRSGQINSETGNGR